MYISQAARNARVVAKKKENKERGEKKGKGEKINYRSFSCHVAGISRFAYLRNDIRRRYVKHGQISVILRLYQRPLRESRRDRDIPQELEFN
jgi:hypothetical protein